MFAITQRRPRCRALIGGLVLGLSAGLVVSSPGEEPKGAAPVESKGAQEKGKWVPLFQRHAGEYVIRTGPDVQKETRRVAEPLLRWWQPVRGGDDGALYLWVRDGRPVAAVTFFTFKWPDGNRSIVHERHSFAPGPLEAEWRGNPVWKTSEPGVTFRPVPDAPAPAANAPGRLRQMQALARGFSAETTDDKGASWTLRTLARPLFRNEGKVDGGLFALVQGTDPEAFLLFEARGEGKDAHWEYAVARFTDLKIRVRYRDHEVFEGPHTIGGPAEIYHSVIAINKPSDSPQDFD